MNGLANYFWQVDLSSVSVTFWIVVHRGSTNIFRRGTVSGAPKVKAMELIAKLEREKRGVYAGAVGYFGYNTVTDGEMEEGAMDT